MTSTRFDLPVPLGSTTEPRTIWSAYFGFTPRRTATSTVSSHFPEIFVRGRISQACSTEYFLIGSQPSTALRYFLPAMVSSVWPWSSLAQASCQGGHIGRYVDSNELAWIRTSSPDSVDDVEAHRASGASDLAVRRLDVRGVEIGHL